MNIPSACAGAKEERTRKAALGVTDVSGVPRAVIKGRRCNDVLAAAGWPVPENFFEPALKDPWAFVARTGRTELFIEGPMVLVEPVSPEAMVYSREDASLLLSGVRLSDLLAEITSIPIDLASSRLHLTDIMRVSGMILPRPGGSVPCVQIWLDPTYAFHAGQALVAIATELGGGWVGADTLENSGVFPPMLD
jgi:hypothetical protein